MEDNWLFTTEPWDLPGKQTVSSSQQAYFAHGPASHAPSSHRMGLASQNQQGRTINSLDNELPYGEPHMLAKARPQQQTIEHLRKADTSSPASIHSNSTACSQSTQFGHSNHAQNPGQYQEVNMVPQGNSLSDPMLLRGSYSNPSQHMHHPPQTSQQQQQQQVQNMQQQQHPHHHQQHQQQQYYHQQQQHQQRAQHQQHQQQQHQQQQGYHQGSMHPDARYQQGTMPMVPSRLGSTQPNPMRNHHASMPSHQPMGMPSSFMDDPISSLLDGVPQHPLVPIRTLTSRSLESLLDESMPDRGFSLMPDPLAGHGLLFPSDGSGDFSPIIRLNSADNTPFGLKQEADLHGNPFSMGHQQTSGPGSAMRLNPDLRIDPGMAPYEPNHANNTSRSTCYGPMSDASAFRTRHAAMGDMMPSGAPSSLAAAAAGGMGPGAARSPRPGPGHLMIPTAHSPSLSNHMHTASPRGGPMSGTPRSRSHGAGALRGGGDLLLPPGAHHSGSRASSGGTQSEESADFMLDSSTGDSKKSRLGPKKDSMKKRGPLAGPKATTGGQKPGRRITCRNCGTHQTPQWRCGPEGPRTLCNACGVRYKKGLPLQYIERRRAAERQTGGSGGGGTPRSAAHSPMIPAMYPQQH